MINHSSYAHYMTRQDNSWQQNCFLMGGYDATQQKSDLVLSDLAMLDIYNKARLLSHHVIAPPLPSGTSHDFPVESCLVSGCVMCGAYQSSQGVWIMNNLYLSCFLLLYIYQITSCNAMFVWCMYYNRMNIYVCIIDMSVPHEVKNYCSS